MFHIEGIQATEPSALFDLPGGIGLNVRPERDTQGFYTVDLVGEDREDLIAFLVDNWGDDAATGGWTSEQIQRIRCDEPLHPADGDQGRTLVVRYDVSGLTDRQIEVLTGEAEAQAERNKSPFPEDDHPSVKVTSEIVPPLPVAEPRTILVHLNVEVPASYSHNAETLADEVIGAITVAGEERDHCP